MNRTQKPREGRSPAARASTVSILSNFVLALVKLLSGILFSAPTLISDAVHSASDIVSATVVSVGIRLSKRPPDQCHPYGHDRIEGLASILLSTILLAAGLGIGLDGVQNVVTRRYTAAESPLPAAVLVALCSVVTKLFLTRYLYKKSRKEHSALLRADALHQVSDALASGCALVGTASSILGLRILDPIASILISFFLLRAAYTVFREASEGLTDRSVGAVEEETLRRTVERLGGYPVRALRSRRSGSYVYLEIELSVDPTVTASVYGRAAERITEGLPKESPRVKGCTVSLPRP